MSTATLIGIDMGKHSFHLHGQDSSGGVVFRKTSTRLQMMRLLGNLPSCTVVMEACAGSHYMARQIKALGHEMKLISPQFVRPFVKGNKNEFIDAEAICEAASRPTMRFVTPKTEVQQTLSVLHLMRESLVRDRTKTANQARVHCESAAIQTWWCAHWPTSWPGSPGLSRLTTQSSKQGQAQ